MEIFLDNRVGPKVPGLAGLAPGIKRALNSLSCPPDTELSVVLTDNQEIAELNRRFLGRRGATNVLAFPMAQGELKGTNPGLLGDVVVSVEYAAQEASENGLDEAEHLMRLLLHGILHLLGYDHIGDKVKARQMEELTESLLDLSLNPAKEG